MRQHNLILIIPLFMLMSCEKSFLDVKVNKSLVVPSTISDYQAILDDASGSMNASSAHELGVIGADEIELWYPIWQQMSNLIYQKNGYVWAKEVYGGEDINDWNRAYRRILFANTASDGIESIKPNASEQSSWNNVKGSALFFRAFNFYQLDQLFGAPYNFQSASADLGIPLRTQADITVHTSRSTVKETYEQIIKDLKSSVELLPDLPIVIYRPSKGAAYALLARVYLQMGDYQNALIFSNLGLGIKNSLIDFNQVNSDATYTFPVQGLNNTEVIFMCNMSNIGIAGTSRINISTELLNLYASDDLRKILYYKTGTDGRILFKGSYVGSISLFTGLATDEVLLIRAEAYARTGNTEKALADLNALRSKRINENTYTDISASDNQEILRLILEERRKELVLRGTRWEDLRRLNQEPAFAKTLYRNLDGVTYELPPGDLRYTWAIPDKAIDLGGYIQNPR